MSELRATARLARFTHYKAEPARSIGLRADHPALTDGHTIFPTTVVGAMQSPRFLISGANSSKVGKTVEKGPWAGMPIFTLTLEERATCPSSCAQWAGCYGNAMQWARRNDAFDPDFISALKAEVVTLVREVCGVLPNKPDMAKPRGIVIRLHVLGDFFSVAYVRAWGEMLARLPQIHVFGYTARRIDDEDAGSRAIAEAVQAVTEAHWDRFAIRTSHPAAGPQRAVVVDAWPDGASVIRCPAQVAASEACATCGLCWAQATRSKAIGFLRHGMKVRGPARITVDKPRKIAAIRAHAPSTAEDRLAQLSDADRQRIAAAYGAAFKTERAA